MKHVPVLWIQPGKCPSNPENVPFPCGYDPENVPIAARRTLSGAGSSFLKTVLRKNDLKNGDCVASSQRKTSQPCGYPRAGALGWPMRLRRGRAGQAPQPRNERLTAHCPPLVCRSLAARRAGFPVSQVKSRKTGKPTPVLAGRQLGQALKPHLPQRLKDGVTARASSPRVLAASGCGPRQGLDALSVPNSCAAHWLFRQYRDRRRCGSPRKGGQGVGAARSRLR